MALKPALVSAITLACCAPLPLPFSLLIALFRSQEFVALQLHSQVGLWSLSSGHSCRMNNNLCKIKPPQSGLSKRSRALQEGFSHGTGCVGQQEVLLWRVGRAWWWLCEGLLLGCAAHGAGLWVQTAEERRVHTELWVRDRHVLQGHPLLPWWTAVPVSPCTGIILCRTQRVQSVIAKPISFAFFHSSGA